MLILCYNIAAKKNKGGRILISFISKSTAETESFAEKLAKKISGGTVVALYGGLGMGKTAFMRGFAKGLGNESFVSSPTFALVNDYGGSPQLVHFDMYKVETWDDLYTSGFFDYLDMGAVICTEWSENIENALPENTVKVRLSAGKADNERVITVEGLVNHENFSN